MTDRLHQQLPDRAPFSSITTEKNSGGIMSDHLPSPLIKPENHFGSLFGPDYSIGQHNELYEENVIDNESKGVFRMIDESNFLRQQSEQQQQQPVESDINGGRDVNGDAPVVKNHVPNQTNGVRHSVNGNNSLRPVLPGESGEGLPYAPVDWPNPGDNWSWKVGKRYKASGYFQDRFLSPPKRFHPEKKKLTFASQFSVETFVRGKFPGANVDAFFASFSWNIPAKIEPPSKVKPAPLPDNFLHDESQRAEKKEEFFSSGRKKRKVVTPVPLDVEEEVIQKKIKAPRSSQRKKKHDEPTTATPARTIRRAKPFSSSATKDKESAPENIAHLIPEDFDQYLSSLEDILAQPVSRAPASCSATTDSHIDEGEMAKLRSQLSSLLVMDFPTLVLSGNISKVIALASELRQDPRLSAEQLVKLKLIEEIPLFSEVFLESRETIQEVDRCFGSLEANKVKVASLKNEYSELKEKADELQSEVDASIVTVQEIDNQIAELQAWRAELTSIIQNREAAKLEVTSTQGMVANSIPTVVHEIQVGIARIPEWGLKRANAAKREAEILEKFAPLRGLSL